MVTDSDRSRLARAVPTAASHEVGMPSGYSASPRSSLFQPQHGRAGQRAAIEEAVRLVRASRS